MGDGSQAPDADDPPWERWTVDLREASFDEIAAFVFDHPVEAPEVGETPRGWWWNQDFDAAHDPARNLAFLTRVLEGPPTLLADFSDAQVEQGLWFAVGPVGGELFTEHLWNPAVPWEDRRACIAAMGAAYDGLLADRELDTIPEMLWDLVASGYDFGRRDPLANAEDRRVQQAMFDTLSRQLDSADPFTQYAAIHGLGHLCHRRSRSSVEGFLASGRWIEPDVRCYAEKYLEHGQVL